MIQVKDTMIPDMQSILRIEDDLALCELLCPGTDLLLWPMIRTPFLRLILSDFLYETPIPTARAAVRSKSQQAMGLAKATAHNIRSGRNKAEVLIRSSAIGGQIKEGKAFNRHSDYFVDAASQKTMVLEDLSGGLPPQNRHNPNVIYHDPILVHASIQAKISRTNRHAKLINDLVTRISNRAKAELDWDLTPQHREWFCALVARYIARAPSLISSYKKLLSKLGTKLMIAEEACYGNSMVCMIGAARQLGVITAEYQHGMVSKGHDAYVLAPTLAQNSTYKQSLPDYFLGYGAWWNAQMSVPVEKIAIGNPHRSEILAAHKCNRSNKKDLLILGDGIESEMYIHFAQELSQRLPLHKVVLRPHPLERAYFEQTYPSGSIGTILIDKNQNIYDSFTTATAVISEMSTGLFEAIGIADSVFMWSTPKANFYLPTHPFEAFNDIKSLSAKLENPIINQENTNTMEDVWAPNWQENYTTFLQETINR